MLSMGSGPSEVECQRGRPRWSRHASRSDTGLFTNVASVDSNTPDPDPDNNDSSAEVLAAEATPQTGTDIDGIIRAGSALVLLGSILVVMTLQRRRRRLV